MIDSDVTSQSILKIEVKDMKYTYRQFADITNTTLRTLRYYESIGLITSIEEDNKKYIDESYFVQIQTIQLLKKAGYTLEEIKHSLKDKNIEEQIIIQKDMLHIQLTNTKTMLSLIDELQSNKTMNMPDIYKRFLQIQNNQNLQLQFETTDGLKTRVFFHHHHTHFNNNFHEWMFEQYDFHPGDKVLEIGCGDGTIWQCNADNIPKDIEIIVSDISQKMIDECRDKLHDIPQIVAYEYADCFCLPYDDESFDVVIANHVFMYFEHLEDALKEVERVLKKGGVLYCSTIAKDMMKERDDLLRRFDRKISFDQETLYTRFGYENGKERLSKYFCDIELFDRKEIYEITDVDLFYHFMLSGKGLSTNLETLYKRKQEFYDYVKDYFNRNKVFYLTTHAGMFAARKGE